MIFSRPSLLRTISLSFFCSFLLACRPGTNESKLQSMDTSGNVMIRVGAERTEVYFPKLKGKRVAIIANQSSLVEGVHLLDTLLGAGVNVVKIFTPEHGFRGSVEAGAHVSSATDAESGLPIVSLYGKNKTLPSALLEDVDVLLFDLQDVGTRFYTYISTMHYAMESCATGNTKFIVLDRPNPNGSYVDGPVLKKGFESFVGLHPIPVAHGLTVGELALMINGEGWLNGGRKAELEVVPLANYTHDSAYHLPVRPSPNLPNHQAVKLYPSLCFFEGTAISVARGTDFPFQAIGAPFGQLGDFQFQPESRPGASLDPPYKNKVCHGLDLQKVSEPDRIRLDYLLEFYKNYPEKEKFFIPFFEKLAGTDQLRKDIVAGKDEAGIRKGWQADLDTYKKMRAGYLLYP